MRRIPISRSGYLLRGRKKQRARSSSLLRSVCGERKADTESEESAVQKVGEKCFSLGSDTLQIQIIFSYLYKLVAVFGYNIKEKLGQFVFKVWIQ